MPPTPTSTIIRMAEIAAIGEPAPPRANENSLRIYHLLEAERVSENANVIARALFGMRSLEEQGRGFSVHPICGSVSYWNFGALVAPRRFPVRTIGNNPERAARQFIEEGRKKLAGASRQASFPLQSLLPSSLTKPYVAGVTPKGAASPDHVICRFGVELPLDGVRKVRVHGATLDMRIGIGDVVLGFKLRWRPIQGEGLSPEISPSAAADTGSAPHSHGAAELSEELVYLLADDNERQTHLAPVYLSLAGHHGAIRAASSHSLVVELVARRTSRGADVGAQIDGGSGSFRFSWTCWRLTASAEEEVRTFGNTPIIQLEPGAWNVAVIIEDRMTGATAKAERMLVAPFADPADG